MKTFKDIEAGIAAVVREAKDNPLSVEDLTATIALLTISHEALLKRLENQEAAMRDVLQQLLIISIQMKGKGLDA